MSGSTGLAGNWRTGLMPGSWRGIPFMCRDTSRPAGRRLAKFEFPDSDQVAVQDLGRGMKIYKLAIYVAGDDYMTQRDALETALDADGPGTLVHPYKGPLQVYAEHPCQLKELSEKGRAAYFECSFVEAGGAPAPASAPATQSLAFSGAQPVFAQLALAFGAGIWLYDGQSLTVQGAAVAALSAVPASIGSLLTAAGSAPLALAQDLPLLAAVAADDTSGYAAALAGLLQDYVAAIVTDAADAATPDLSAPAGYQDWSRLPAMPSDPSYGLAALAGAGASLVPTAATGQAAANWAALMQAVQGSAVAALLMLYAQTAFAAAEDADTARTQVNQLVIAQIEAAAGNDPLVQTWRSALSAAVTYLTTTAKQVPDVAQLITASPQPAAVLAQLLYQDGSQAAALVQRNAAPHPLFMPLAVEYLVA